ncbi:MAG: hypothetical protein F6K65_14730 [Moorea sp. SIO3C2]|nr:hypothetical protein [Moorena sp. SIO3C2]
MLAVIIDFPVVGGYTDYRQRQIEKAIGRRPRYAIALTYPGNAIAEPSKQLD